MASLLLHYSILMKSNDYIEITRSFIEIACSKILEKPEIYDNTTIINFFICVNSFLFFKPQNIANDDFITINNVSDIDDLAENFDVQKMKNSRFNLSHNNLSWKDKEIAKNVLSIFEIFQTKEVIIYDLLIAYFLIYDEPNFVINHMTHIQFLCTSSSIFKLFTYIYFRLYLVGKVSFNNIDLRDISLDECFLSFTEHIEKLNNIIIIRESLDILANIKTFVKDQSQQKILYPQHNDLYFSFCQLSQHNIAVKMNENNELNKKRWLHIWSCLTISGAPWSMANPPTIHYTRDFTNCYMLCPFKTKRNWKYSPSEFTHLIPSRSTDANISRMLRKFSHANDESIPDTYANEQRIRYSSACEAIFMKRTDHVEFSICNDSIMLSMADNHRITIPLQNVLYILPRTHLHHKTAIEIFSKDGRSLFLNFQESSSDEIMKIIPNIENMNYFIKPEDATLMWKQNLFTNFEYLLLLNIFSGRSFNNPSQYPIFPWILKNYNKLDLNEDDVFRDLSKPIGALNNENLEELKEIMEFMCEQGVGLFNKAMISPSDIYHYMCRLEPFKTLKKNYFDNRHFDSIINEWNNVMSEDSTFNELIPEFFFQPEFLCCDELGKVELPPWAKNEVEFIYFHRKALESPYVSKNLNKWIDLVFGVNQKNIEKNNVFSEYAYEDVWNDDNLNDSLKRNLIESSKRAKGQIPTQLFTAQHPSRQDIQENSKLHHNIKINIEGVLFSKMNCCGTIKIITDQYKLVVYNINTNSIIVKQLKLSNAKFSDFGDNIIAYSENELYEINQNGQETIIHCSNLQNFTSLYPWLATVGTDLIIRISNATNLREPVQTITYFREKTECCVINNDFHVLVIGSNKGDLIIYSLERSVSFRVVSLGKCIVNSVVITPSWGFIVAFASETSDGKATFFSKTFNINGMLIRRVEIPGIVKVITTWKSIHGFDFLAFAVERTVFICEAFYMNFNEPFMILETPPIEISYLTQTDEIAVITREGSIKFKQVHVDDLLIL
ncbi:hypothetical protein TRFO_07986 [Tritrichomonas foetus]|uniref:Beige/BEACH domain containing protein n=1 Tax=Tritrichomonas foetus TaxID=1144522 RepID=A0A1J4JNN2_9EUKA|nr:hypothetical protein TRFO_07986 [Tritrichomonas foetus]|eukprot:OHT00322.1 hypothetical protein TRFO_07986 [Tritrichomonas foetus]